MLVSVLNEGSVEYIPYSLSDLTPANAARVSFAKRVNEFVLANTPEASKRYKETGMGNDESLLNYLSRNGHWTPFAHVRVLLKVDFNGDVLDAAEFLCKLPHGSRAKIDPYTTTGLYISTSVYSAVHICPELQERIPVTYAALTTHCDNPFPFKPQSVMLLKDFSDWPEETPLTYCIKAPIFVARQLFKHKYGFVENEVSRRYVSDTPTYFYPDDNMYRKAPDGSIKQGSSFETVHSTVNYDAYTTIYEQQLKEGVAPELARASLPQSMYTQWWLTGSISDFARLIKQRLHPHAQWETKQYALALRELIPVDLHYLVGDLWQQ